MARSYEAADKIGMEAAVAQAQKSYNEGGVPIGCALVWHGEPGDEPKLLGAGHNQRIQKGSATLHGGISVFENAGRLKPEVYRKSTVYTTTAPCSMCTGAALLYRVPRCVIGENVLYKGGEDYLASRGVEVKVLDSEECKELMARFIREKPEEWNEDTGGVPTTAA